jgi:RNA polymerase sigma-70 factor, ECF subfamily
LSAGNFSESFEQDFLPHLNSAYNLARWLTRNEHDAQDMVQEAYLRAFKAYRGFRGGDARPWLMKIVRNVCYTSMQACASHEFINFDDDRFACSQSSMNAEQLLIEENKTLLMRKALAMLPARWREIVVLRELEEMSYKEISNIMNVPTGTVMSTLSRARARLLQFIDSMSNAKISNGGQ